MEKNRLYGGGFRNHVNNVPNCVGDSKANSVQINADHYGVALEQADGKCHLELGALNTGNPGNRGDMGDPYNSTITNPTPTFSSNTTPASLDYDNNNPSVSVSNISACQPIMTADILAYPIPVSASGSGPVDVVFLMDLTGSYADDLPQIKLEMPVIVDQLAAVFPDIRFGLASFRDFPILPFGSSTNDYAYRLELPLNFNQMTFLTAVDSLQAYSDGDLPESQHEALYQLLT